LNKTGGYLTNSNSPTTKVEIIRNRLLKLIASTLIRYEVDAHISNPWSHAQPTHVVQGSGTKDSICGWYTSKISTLCLSRWIQHFCTTTQFSSSLFSSSLQQKAIRYLTHGTSVGAGFTMATHLCITYLPLYNILFSTLDLFAMTIHVASFSLKGSSYCNHGHPCHEVTMTCATRWAKYGHWVKSANRKRVDVKQGSWQ